MKFQSFIEEYEYLKDKIRDSENYIKEIKTNKILGERIARIEKISGIGIISATRFVIFLFDIKDRFVSGEKLVHHLGLTPGEWSSGEDVRKGRTGLTGDKKLRSIIIQLAWIAVRKDGSLLNKFDRVYKKTGCKQKAIVAVARKLMVKVHAITVKEEDYVVNKAA